MIPKYAVVVVSILALEFTYAQNATLESELATCFAITDGLERIQCYDELASTVMEMGEGSIADPTVEISKNAASALSSIVDDLAIKVKQNWIAPEGFTEGMKAIVKIAVEPDGSVNSVETVKSSGSPEFDLSTEAAVIAASPLPFPDNSEYYPFIKEFAFEFEP